MHPVAHCPQASASSPTVLPTLGQDVTCALPPADCHHCQTKSQLQFSDKIDAPCTSTRLKKKKRLPRKPDPKPLNSVLLKLKLIFHASGTTSRNLVSAVGCLCWPLPPRKLILQHLARVVQYYKTRVYHSGSDWKNTNENYQNGSTVKEKAFFAFFILYYYLLDIGLQYQFTKLVTLTGLLLCATHCTNSHTLVSATLLEDDCEVGKSSYFTLTICKALP